jgi:DNA-binding transcriptional ArsR family regulator
MGYGETFKALADPARRRILELLRKGSLTAGEIAEHFDMSNATVSYHLAVLKKADLVTESRRKNFIDYSLNASVLEEIMIWLESLKEDSEQ